MSLQDNFAETGVKKAKVRASVLTSGKKPKPASTESAPAAAAPAAKKPAPAASSSGGSGEAPAVSVTAVSRHLSMSVCYLINTEREVMVRDVVISLSHNYGRLLSLQINLTWFVRLECETMAHWIILSLVLVNKELLNLNPSTGA